jgi:hypothetical protein
LLKYAEGRDQPGDLLKREEEICGPVARRDAAAEADRIRECVPEEDRGGPDAGSGDAPGRYPAKALKSGRARELVRGMNQQWFMILADAAE